MGVWEIFSPPIRPSLHPPTRNVSLTNRADTETLLNTLKKTALRLAPEEASFARRGFEGGDPAVRVRLEGIIRTFIGGYQLALESDDDARLVERLEAEFDAHHVGFAYEGAGLCFAVLDVLWPVGASRLRAFTDGPARHQDYIVTVGAGFALAKVPWGRWRLRGYTRQLDPLLAWCVPDGVGFHEGFFRPRRYVDEQAPPPAAFPDWAQQLFDSGLGRSLWWSRCADADRLRHTIDGFDAARRAELWAGIGVALAYAGGLDASAVPALVDAAGPYRADLLSGIPFAAEMRRKAGNRAPWTETICRALLDRSTEEAADLVMDLRDQILAGWPDWHAEIGGRTYPLLRRRLVAQLTPQPLFDAPHPESW